MTDPLRLPCPTCSGTGTDTHEDRHTETNRDTCRTCGGTGAIPPRTGESAEASFSADRPDALTPGGQKLADALFEQGLIYQTETGDCLAHPMGRDLRPDLNAMATTLALDAKPASEITEGLRKIVNLDYTNHRGERKHYDIRPTGRFVTDETYHPAVPYLIEGVDVARNVVRTFDPARIHAWNDVPVPASPGGADVEGLREANRLHHEALNSFNDGTGTWGHVADTERALERHYEALSVALARPDHKGQAAAGVGDVKGVARRIAEELGRDFDKLPSISFREEFTQDDFLRAALAALTQPNQTPEAAAPLTVERIGKDGAGVSVIFARSEYDSEAHHYEEPLNGLVVVLDVDGTIQRLEVEDIKADMTRPVERPEAAAPSGSAGEDAEHVRDLERQEVADGAWGGGLAPGRARELLGRPAAQPPAPKTPGADAAGVEEIAKAILRGQGHSDEAVEALQGSGCLSWHSAVRSAKEVAALTAPQAAQPGDEVIAEVAAERRRQIEAEGWTPEHDDLHARGEMATAAACYAYVAPLGEHDRARLAREGAPHRWPWHASWWKPTHARRDLVKACALLIAEIERLDRTTPDKAETGEGRS